LIEVRQIRVEKIVRQKRGDGAEQNEHADENVARRVGEITDEISLEYGVKYFRVHGSCQ
jgi:hypothetical protein